jgi:hypothetical protein
VSDVRGPGIPSVRVDTDGDMASLVLLFLEAGVNTMMPFEVQAGSDIFDVRRRFGDAFSIVADIDKRAIAYDRPAIRREGDRVLPLFLETGRYLPCLGHTVPTDVPLDSFGYYQDCVKSYEP